MVGGGVKCFVQVNLLSSSSVYFTETKKQRPYTGARANDTLHK